MSHRGSAVLSKQTLHQASFLALKTITYLNPYGKESHWETVERTTRKGGMELDAVLVCATDRVTREVLLVSQFRPSTGKVTWEWPAGLVDGEGESVEQAALRELNEEAGIPQETVKVVLVSPVMFQDPGITNDAIKLVAVEVDKQSQGEPAFDGEEYIESMWVRKNELYDFLEKEAERGRGIDSRLLSMAAAIKIWGEKGGGLAV